MTPAAVGPRLVVFSDLDGTLLDHESYDFAPARPALAALRAGGHALILASSKTASEIRQLRASLGFGHCEAIVENGGGVLEAGGNRVAGPSGERKRLLEILASLPNDPARNFLGFSQMDITRIVELTGLSAEEAELAADRQFTEPGIWNGPDTAFAEFVEFLARHGVTARRGGRFVTLGFGRTKADRMDEIAASYAVRGRSIITVALGDAPNDMEMIEKADIGIIIANSAHAGIARLAQEETGRIRRSGLEGPEGWNREMLKLLEELTVADRA